MQKKGFITLLRRRVAKLCLMAGSWFGYRQVPGNFHVVLEGQLYRSAQPTSLELRRYASTCGLKTVVNLRGRRDNRAWYTDELAEARRLGINHLDFKLSSRHELTMDEVQSLVAVLRDVPKPILIHCKAGADRCGIVAAIYLHEIAGVEVEVAKRQISYTYGHFGIPYLSRTHAMDRTWKKLEEVYRIGDQAAAL